MTDIRQLLLAAFEVEHREHIDAIRAALGAAIAGGTPDWNDIFRRAHSLKGAARAVDLPPVEAVAHRLETLFERITAGDSALDRESVNATHLALDRIEAFVAAMKNGAVAMPDDVLAALDRCLDAEGVSAAHVPASVPDAAAPDRAEPAPTRPDPAGEPATLKPVPAAEAAESAATLIRVPADTIEALSRASHDLMAALSGEASVGDGLARIVRLATDLRRRVEALGGDRTRVARRDGDGAAAHRDLLGLGTALGGLAREATVLARRHAETANGVDLAAARVRAEAERLGLVPAETVFGGLARALRDTARDQGREVDVTTRGLDLPVDRLMLQTLKDPVLHALRNALSHGAEPAASRRAKGKPEALSIALDVAIRGSRLVVSIQDDGPGPDLDAIAATARRRGLLGPDEAAGPDALLDLVFAPGFSTALAVDTLSGRGFGLSVVADAARSLQGSARLEPRVPSGTALTLSLPLSAARRSILLVEAGGAVYGLPGAAVERLLRLDRDAMAHVLGRPIVQVEGPGGARTTHAVIALADLIGTRSGAAEDAVATVILLRTTAGRIALAVDSLREVRTLLVLPAPAVGADSALFVGTTILPGDVPVLILDPEGIAGRAGRETGAIAAPTDGTMREAPRSPGRATILVVDDSITTRTLEKGILEAAGYRVVVCVDGQDALERLRAEVEPVDLVLADVEMPRLDGFGLVQALRADDRFARLPLILMTSRGDAQDVARGLDLGADAYLTKQTFDQRKLLDTIGQLL